MLLVVAAFFVIARWDRLRSGEPFLVVTGVGVAAFWISVVFVRVVPGGDDRTDADAWRRLARQRMLLLGGWTAASVVWLATAAALYSIRPLNLVAVAIPALMLLSSWWTYRLADRLAETERRVSGRTTA